MSISKAAQGGSSLCLLFTLSFPLLRKPSYEIFIRTHQALATLSAYAIWRHLALQPLIPRLYIYISALTFLSTLLLQCVFVIYRNRIISGGCTRASISHVNDIVKIRLTLTRPLKVEAGQYVCLWIPRVSFWSFLQSHPFIVTSWSEGKQSSLDLFVSPRRGFTRELLNHSKVDRDGPSSCIAPFSGPHGISAPVGDYETVLMIASGFGMAAQLPYLKQLIYGYNACKIRTRRIHLVWQLETLGKLQILASRMSRKLTTAEVGIAMEPLLNDALIDDTLDEGYVSNAALELISDMLT